MELPTIKVKEGPTVTHTSVEMEVPDDVYDTIVNIGKESASDSDYFRIGFLAMLGEYLNDKSTDE